MKKRILMLLGVMLICSCTSKQEQATKAPIRVKTEVVQTATSTNGQTYVGIVEECEATAVSFTSMGVVKRMLVNEGQAVAKGQLIAEMDDTQARNLLSSAEAQMEAQMAQANDALERYKMLHDAGSLPEVQWVDIQSKVAQAKSQLEVAKKNLADCRLVAPVSGIVGKRLVGAGETAMPSQAVVSILDISTVKVKVAIPEAEIIGTAENEPAYWRLVKQQLPDLVLLPIVAAALFLFDRRVFAQVDYALLATFVCFFVFSGNMANMPEMQDLLGGLMTGHPMLTSLIASQVISNVPSAVLLAGFTENWHSLLIGVDLGGLGTPIASLASLIAFRMYMHTAGASGRTFMREFAIANVVALALMTVLYALLFVVKIA